MTLYSSDNVGTVGNKIEINNNVGDGGDFLGDGGLLIGDGGDLLGDGGNLNGDGGDLLADGGNLHVGNLVFLHVSHYGGHHNVLLTLCEESGMLTEYKSEIITNGQTDIRECYRCLRI